MSLILQGIDAIMILVGLLTVLFTSSFAVTFGIKLALIFVERR